MNNIFLSSKFFVDFIKFLKIFWQVQVLHEHVHLLPLTGEVDGVVLVPLRQVGVRGEEPDRVELLAQLYVAPDREAEDDQGKQDYQALDRLQHDQVCQGFKNCLQDIPLTELVWLEVLVFDARQGSIPLVLYPPLVDAEPGHEPGGLQDVHHDQPHRTEDAEGPKRRQNLLKMKISENL